MEDIELKSRVVHPAHYNWIPGIECVEVAEHFSYNAGAALKYIWRAPTKEFDEAIVDYHKAIFYLEREIKLTELHKEQQKEFFDEHQ